MRHSKSWIINEVLKKSVHIWLLSFRYHWPKSGVHTAFIIIWFTGCLTERRWGGKYFQNVTYGRLQAADGPTSQHARTEHSKQHDKWSIVMRICPHHAFHASFQVHFYCVFFWFSWGIQIISLLLLLLCYHYYAYHLTIGYHMEQNVIGMRQIEFVCGLNCTNLMFLRMWEVRTVKLLQIKCHGPNRQLGRYEASKSRENVFFSGSKQSSHACRCPVQYVQKGYRQCTCLDYRYVIVINVKDTSPCRKYLTTL